jgi:hypothetical protein
MQPHTLPSHSSALRKNCHKLWASGYTSYASIFLHAVVFAVLLAASGMAIRRYVK